MYANAYQNAPCFEVWDSKVDPAKNNLYKQLFKVTPNSNPRAFDKQAKSYLTTIQGQSGKMILPAQDNKTLSLHQRYLVLHIFIPVGFQWWLELVLCDLNGIKRRIYMTTVQGKQQAKYFSYRYPLQVSKGGWLFLGIDVYSFMNAFKGQTFRGLDQISIGSSCKLRRIFTMKQFVQFDIPNGYWLNQEIGQSLELIEFKEQSKSLLLNKQLTESVPVPSPKRQQVKKSLSNSRRKDLSNQLSPKSQKHTSGSVLDKKMIKSEIIIQNARMRLQNLQKQEQLIEKRSKELQSRPFLQQKAQTIQQRVQAKPTNRKSQTRKLQIIKEETQKQRSNNKNKAINQNNREQQEIKRVKSKLPLLQKPFKEDEGRGEIYQQSSATEDHHQNNKHRFLQSKQLIQSDLWEAGDRKQTPLVEDNTMTYSKIKVTRGSANIGNGLFPSTIITKQNNNQIVVKKSKQQLQLIYDQMAGCYYHPETNTYYEVT